MYKKWIEGMVLVVTLVPSVAPAQEACTSGIHIDGTITDPTGAVIPGAQVQAASGERATTDATGHYLLPCVSGGSAAITVRAEGFSRGTARAHARLGGTAHVSLQLAVASVQTDVQVSADADNVDSSNGAGTTVLGRERVQQMADDPDDFQRQLQSLAAVGGGIPGSAIITVDGFQNASALPPKSSIGSIRVNPDMFSAEYGRAPYLGGQVEIFTKPGADRFHGALFFTDSDSSFNATDPLSASATPAGKRRYGFELSGPVISKKSGFSLALEKRDIDEFNVVNAQTPDQNGNPVPFQQAVSAPQRLWIASARNDWQVGSKDVATLSFSANVNNLANQGIGGLTLAEAGYSSLVSEYDLRLSNVLTLNPNMLHETRIGYSWKRTEQAPLSTAPSLQVAGFFTGGGATSQNLNDRERDLEVDDDLMVTQGKHTWKIGTQSFGFFLHDYDPDTFNGAYVFGGGSAPELDANNQPTGQTTTINAIQQYHRALLNLPGGTPTTYQLTTGTPVVPLTQWRLAVFGQDAIKLTPRFTFVAGLRYQLQTTPGSFGNFSPRVGIAWSPDKKSNWVVHLRAGIFRNPNDSSYATEVYRLNRTRQQETTAYSPNYSDPLTPTPGSIQVGTENQFAHSLNQLSSFQTHISIERNFHDGWHTSATFYWDETWGRVQTRNINAPMVGNSVGIPPDPTTALLAPRPITPNENIVQYENFGHLTANIFAIGGGRNIGERFGISVYYVHDNTKTNVSDALASPQSSYSDKGESSRSDGQGDNAVYASGSLHLPYKVEVSSIFDVRSGVPYNITTGTDANGDGDFNDRPSYASVLGPGVYNTRFGLLTTNTVNGDVPRNLGTQSALVHLDANLTRAFMLNPKDNDHPRTLTFNARSANLLNHTNVTTVNTILSSSTLGQPLTAETARRLELGLRFSF